MGLNVHGPGAGLRVWWVSRCCIFAVTFEPSGMRTSTRDLIVSIVAVQLSSNWYQSNT